MTTMFKTDRAASRKLVWRQKRYLGLLLDRINHLQQDSTGMASICYPGTTCNERCISLLDTQGAMFQTDREDSDKRKSNPMWRQTCCLHQEPWLWFTLLAGQGKPWLDHQALKSSQTKINRLQEVKCDWYWSVFSQKWVANSAVTQFRFKI